MDFEFSEELNMLRSMVAKFAETEIAPLSYDCDKEERCTPEITRKAGELGLIGAWAPEECGGSGFGWQGMAIVAEELSRIDLGIGINIITSGFGSQIIYHYGTDEQKKKYLPPIFSGEQYMAGAFTEPDAGTDAAGYKTRAVKDNKDYLITGNKMFITHGNICANFMAQCITNPENKTYDRFSTIIVPADSPGLGKSKIHGKMGIRATDTAELSFEDVRVPHENLVGKEGKGFPQLMHFFQLMRILVGGQSIGLSRACLEESVKYAKERKVFGAPIGSYQLTMAKLTEMAIRIETLANTTYKAAWQADVGKADHILSAMVKYYAGQTAVFCANAALEIHGGYGYIDEYKVQKFYRDAKVLEIYEGVKEAEIMVIGRAVQSR
jgi:alkylation response protein AidB-like acyl-CoA dehydrogenase